MNLARSPWANPLAGGPLSCLVISPKSAHFDIVELAHRVELELDELAPPRSEADANGEDSTAWTEESRRLLGKAREVIVLANVPRNSISEEVRGLLLERLSEGAGLVSIRFGNDPVVFVSEELGGVETVDPESTVLRGIGHAIVPGLTDIAMTLQCYQSPGGRVVDIRYPEETPELHSLFPSPDSLLDIDKSFRDSYYALIVRAMQWASAREDRNRIESVEFLKPVTPDPREVPPFLPKEYVQGIFEKSMEQALRTVIINLDRPAARDYEIGVRPSYPFRMLPTWSLALPRRLKKGETQYSFQTPLSQGDFFLDLWLETSKGTVDWYRKSIQASSWPEITGFQCLRSGLLPNDTAELTFQIEPHALEPRNCLLMARGTDALGRVVAEKFLSVAETAGQFG